MPKQPSKKSKKRTEFSDSESSDDDEPMHFFVPGERINPDVLSLFLFTYIDKTSRIRPCPHPTDKNRTGFNVTAQQVLNTTNLRDIIADTRDWDTESSARSFKQKPYRYHESATAKRRLRVGPSRTSESNDQTSQQTQTKATSPPLSNTVPAAAYPHFSQQQGQQQQQQQASDYPRPGGGYFPASSKPEAQSSTYNINYTSVNTQQYTANVPGASHLPGNPNVYQKPYPSTNYPAQISSKHPYDVPPPYEQQNVRAPRNPQPGQPDPDAYDQDVKPPRSSPMEIPGSRQGSLAPGDDQSNRYSSSNRPGEAYTSGSQRQSQYDASRRPGHRS